ncbi:MAG: lysophospholipid acyltransferase family protein [Gemmataceae bacterium]
MHSRLPDAWYQFNFGLAYMAYTFGLSFKSTGHHHMPRQGPVLVLANHESFLDPLAVGIAVRRQLNYLARKTLFNNPLFGAYLRSVGCVPVDQEGVAKEGLKTSIELLQAGRALLIFPEGERAWDGVMQAFKPGIQLILRKAPVTIVPVGVAGAHEAYPRGAKAPRLAPLVMPPNGAAMACSVGKPIPPERYKKMEREELLQFLFHAVKHEVDQAEKLRIK